MTTKLLTIAIPTWNRQDILYQSLSLLLPQIAVFKEEIQFIISDNASPDNTVKIIEEFLLIYPTLDVVFYKQTENTGYFGNFKKCRELATGKYFWLLSDNEAVLDGRLSIIIKALQNNSEIGLIYLKNIPGNLHLESYELSFDELFNNENYKLTLISTCIMLNNKVQDNLIFKEFKDNSFLGFIFLLTVKLYSNKALEINGNIYQSIPAKVSFNVFESFTYDIFQCFKFIETEGIFNKETVEKMKENILINVLKEHMINYRLYNSFNGKFLGNFNDIYLLLKSYYGHIDRFNEISEIKNASRMRLLSDRYKKKLYKRFRKLVKSLIFTNH